MGGQIGSNPGEDVALVGRGAGSGVPGNRCLREAFEGEGEADCHLHWTVTLAEKTTPVLAELDV